MWAHNEYIGSQRIAGSIQITDEQYAEALDAIAEGKRVSIETGELQFLDPPEPVEPEPAPEPALEEVQEIARLIIDSSAEGARGKYITLGAGQAMTYIQKAQEARDYLTNPNSGNFPLLNAEVGVTADDIHGVATIINGAFTQWQQVGAAIEAIRLGAKANVGSTTTKEEIQSILDGITWP